MSVEIKNVQAELFLSGYFLFTDQEFKNWIIWGIFSGIHKNDFILRPRSQYYFYLTCSAVLRVSFLMYVWFKIHTLK